LAISPFTNSKDALKIFKFRPPYNQGNNELKQGLKNSPLGETLPKKHLQNFTLNDAKIEKFTILI
jgi:hypothetical protein